MLARREVERLVLVALAAAGGRRLARADGLDPAGMPTVQRLVGRLEALAEDDLRQIYELAELGRGAPLTSAHGKACALRRESLIRALAGRRRLAEHLALGLVPVVRPKVPGHGHAD